MWILCVSYFFFFNEPALSRILRIYIYYVEKQFFSYYITLISSQRYRNRINDDLYKAVKPVSTVKLYSAENTLVNYFRRFS